MADLLYTVVGNLSHVNVPVGIQLSVAYLLIDKHPQTAGNLLGCSVRQVRGFGWSGEHIFTVWIRPEDELEWVPCESNMKLLSHDGIMKDIGPTGIMKLGAFECSLSKSDPGQEFFVEDVPCETNDPGQFLDKLEKYYRAPYIPVTVHVPLSERRGFLARTGLR